MSERDKSRLIIHGRVCKYNNAKPSEHERDAFNLPRRTSDYCVLAFEASTHCYASHPLKRAHMATPRLQA